MVAFDPSFKDRVREAVARVEKDSDAEVVVVVAPRSGSYADVDLAAGLLLGLLSLAVVLYSPVVFRPETLLLDIVLFVLLGRFLCSRTPALRRLLTSHRRCKAQVEASAKTAFMDFAVHATRGRTGVLLYLSLLERIGCVLTDRGVDGKVPRAVFSELRLGLERGGSLAALEESLQRGLDLLAERLPAHLPATEDNPDEIPDEPRMLA